MGETAVTLVNFIQYSSRRAYHLPDQCGGDGPISFKVELKILAASFTHYLYKCVIETAHTKFYQTNS